MLSQKAFAQEFKLLASAAEVKQFPKETTREIAFAGRSNCGKSSIINALLNNKSCSRTSSSPGRTQTINFFAVGKGLEQRVLVDFPGYGYAKAPLAIISEWQSLVLRYCKERKALTLLCLVIDARRGLTLQDRGFIKKIGKLRYNLLAMITKIDCLSRSHRDGVAKQIQSELDKITTAKATSCLEVSARKRWGIPEARDALMTLSASENATAKLLTIEKNQAQKELSHD